ncbi:MAG: mandelate racemase/muconate lactonizing enzyme family protein [Pseudomonadota bacterium]
MKLQDLEIFVVGNPPPGFGGRYFLFVKLTTACGVTGYGEVYAASVGPDAMRAVIVDVFERHFAGEAPDRVELLFRRAYSAGFSQRPDPTVIGAFSGLEIACWDIVGKALDRPVHALLGGKVRERVRAYTYLYPAPGEDPAGFYASPEQSAARAAALVEEDGFTAIKFDPAGAYTIWGGHQPSMSDIARSEAFCRAIRAAVGDRADLLFGTHGQFTTSGAIRLGAAIAPHQPLWFEEPVPPDNPAEMARVAAQCTVPIATGERLTTLYEFAQVLRAGAASILQPALGRVGGLWQARKIAALAEGFNAQLAPHLYAGPIEWLANIQLAGALPNFLLLETIGTGGDFHRKLLTDGGPTFETGHVLLPDSPGLGFALDEAVARAHPYDGTALHLEMQQAPPDYSRPSDFAGG